MYFFIFEYHIEEEIDQNIPKRPSSKRTGKMILVATDLSVSPWFQGRLWNG